MGQQSTLRWHFAAAVSFSLLLSVPLAIFGQSPPAWPPERLRDTGLYQDWDAKRVSPDNLAYSPQYPLWTDGAAKARWIHLPPGTFIDASDPDRWKFPVGTRLWKEFRFSRRAETRFIEYTPQGWQYATYEWNDDETDAVLAPERGVSRSVEIQNGIRHAIPSRSDCRACHEAGPARVLGFTALQLSPDRDPNAPHSDPASAAAIYLQGLVDRGLLRDLPPRLLALPPRIQARTATGRAALGYLYGNCSHCHTTAGELASLNFSLQYPLNVRMAPALLTALERPSRFVPSAWNGPAVRLHAGDPDHSVLVARMSSRNPVLQMPPLGTRLVDNDAVALIRRWVTEDLPAVLTLKQSKEDKQ